MNSRRPFWQRFVVQVVTSVVVTLVIVVGAYAVTGETPSQGFRLVALVIGIAAALVVDYRLAR